MDLRGLNYALAEAVLAATDLKPEKKPEGRPRTKEGRWISAGCVVLPSLHPDDLNFVWLIKPSNNFGPWTFPKGRVDKGETIPEAARREVAEESGLIVSLLPGGYLGKGVGTMSVAHYFMAVQTGGNSGNHDGEVEQVKLVSFEEAWRILKSSSNPRDLGILKKAWKFTEKFRERTTNIRNPNLGDVEPVTRGRARPRVPDELVAKKRR